MRKTASAGCLRTQMRSEMILLTEVLVRRMRNILPQAAMKQEEKYG
ncbi:MAG: hypothetical protein K2P59_12800 [Acetatifactor sp.]|nr:hypothetical protein [Acetatifactor sp.]